MVCVVATCDVAETGRGHGIGGVTNVPKRMWSMCVGNALRPGSRAYAQSYSKERKARYTPSNICVASTSMRCQDTTMDTQGFDKHNIVAPLVSLSCFRNARRSSLTRTSKSTVTSKFGHSTALDQAGGCPLRQAVGAPTRPSSP